LPDLIQPIAQLLPLSFVATGLREIIVNGAAIGDILSTLAGLIVWTVVALGLAIWLFVWKEVAA
jgi:ABC-2 type transport system permease protein